MAVASEESKSDDQETLSSIIKEVHSQLRSQLAQGELVILEEHYAH